MIIDKDVQMVNTLKALALESINNAKSGHSGIVLSAAEMMYVLFAKHIKISNINPSYSDRDRFVLSAGHGSVLLYCMLYLNRILEIDDLRAFRQLGSATPGHPEISTMGVDAGTGPLGQGVANAVGMAIAEARLAVQYNMRDNKVYDHHTYCLCGDGDLMEGVAIESIAIAGHLGLNKLTLMYDRNRVTLDGRLSESNSTDYVKMFDACNWNVITVTNGHDMDAIDKALILAKASVDKPTLIICDTTIGRESVLSDTADVHGAVFDTAEIQRLRQMWHLPSEAFSISPEMLIYRDEVAKRVTYNSYKGMSSETWLEMDDREMFGDYKNGANNITNSIDKISFPEIISMRKASGMCLDILAKHDRNICVISADVSKSTYAHITGDNIFSKTNRNSCNIHLGVCEFAMGAIANGIALHGGLKVFVSCFMVFSDYLKPAIRMAAMQHLPIAYLFTHDSIMVGEDGPSHQPVEQLDGLRAIPNIVVIRPCDTAELTMAYDEILTNNSSPVVLALSRNDYPTLKGDYERSKDGVYYISRARSTANAHLIGSGSEVHLLVQAQKKLRKIGIETGVLSAPSLELFKRRPRGYRDRVVQPWEKNRLAVEASSGLAMRSLVGSYGDVICMDTFGASGRPNDVYEKYGFSVDNIVSKTIELIEKNSKPVIKGKDEIE